MEKILKLIKNSNTVAILGHESEDADSVGTSLALASALRNMGKTADVFLSAPLEKRLEFLSDGNLRTDISDGQYDLCIAVDSGDIKRLGDRVKIFERAKHTIEIDHHATNTYFAEENYVVSAASAAGEILFDVISELTQIDKKIAEYLYVAIASDTGSFKYSNVSGETMRKAAYLLDKGIDNAYISRMLFDSDAEEIIKVKGALMNKIETDFSGKLSMITVSDEEFKSYGVEEKDLSDIVNIARGVAGCEVAVSIREMSDKIKISFRSNGKFEVDELAGKFGGGGHKMASGAAVFGKSLAEVKEEIINYVGELLK
ncbi:MAG: bifunctional oligoribonuclease/PAP phosphatase NrnA [Clostridia bacterium]|nr:bifunctional oligoribonuclease/PAP phosphatase NrnA [Clostridia bacterium]